MVHPYIHCDFSVSLVLLSSEDVEVSLLKAETTVTLEGTVICTLVVIARFFVFRRLYTIPNNT